MSLSVAPVEAMASENLAGTDYRMKTTPQGLTALSMAGGAEIQFKGKGFKHETNYNQVVLTPGGVMASLGPVIAPALNDDDVFNSAPMNGHIAYTTPSVMKLLNKEYN